VAGKITFGRGNTAEIYDVSITAANFSPVIYLAPFSCRAYCWNGMTVYRNGQQQTTTDRNGLG